MKGWTKQDEAALEELQAKKNEVQQRYADAIRELFAKAGADTWRGDSPTFAIKNGQALLDVLIQFFEPSPVSYEENLHKGAHVLDATLKAAEKVMREAEGKIPDLIGQPQTLTPTENAGLNKIREVLLHDFDKSVGEFKLPYRYAIQQENNAELKRIMEKLASYDIHFKDMLLNRAIEAEKVLGDAIFEIDMYIKSQPANRYNLGNTVNMVRNSFHLKWVKRVAELTQQTSLCQHEYHPSAVNGDPICRKCGYIKS